MNERAETDDRSDESGYAGKNARQRRPKGEEATAAAVLGFGRFSGGGHAYGWVEMCANPDVKPVGQTSFVVPELQDFITRRRSRIQSRRTLVGL
jgi:hypothetical protein